MKRYLWFIAMPAVVLGCFGGLLIRPYGWTTWLLFCVAVGLTQAMAEQYKDKP